MLQQVAYDRFLERAMNQMHQSGSYMMYTMLESKNEDPPYSLSKIEPKFKLHGASHIPFKTAKWQEWVCESEEFIC